MPYNSNTDRSDAGALIPEDAAREIIQSVAEGSHVLRLSRRLPNMSRAQRRLPVLSALPDAYFVGEAGRAGQTFDQIKQTSQAAWSNVFVNAEEIAVIVPIPENVLEDVDYDIWAEIKPQILASIGARIDTAILFGTSDTDVPVAWPDGVMVQMPAAHVVTAGDVGDLYDDLMGVGGVLSYVEEDGYFVNGHIAALNMRAQLRGLREPNDGRPIFVQDMKSATPYSLDGSRLEFPTNGAFDTSVASIISGDWNQLVWSIRRDVSYKVLTEGVITDNASPRAIIHNLAQDDMVALRVTFRIGWALPNPINRVNTDDATRFPFAALAPAGS